MPSRSLWLFGKRKKDVPISVTFSSCLDTVFVCLFVSYPELHFFPQNRLWNCTLVCHSADVVKCLAFSHFQVTLTPVVLMHTFATISHVTTARTSLGILKWRVVSFSNITQQTHHKAGLRSKTPRLAHLVLLNCSMTNETFLLFYLKTQQNKTKKTPKTKVLFSRISL